MESRQTDRIVDAAYPARRGDHSEIFSAPIRTEQPLPTPKVSHAEKQRLIYPYYAGFSGDFVMGMLDRLLTSKKSKVLDPWNGSGTTTYSAALRGADATGCDLNPALTLVARARVANELDVSRATRAWTHIAKLEGPDDASALRHCEALYRGVVSMNEDSGSDLGPSAKSLILCALFETLRESYNHARTRNPSWFSSKAAEPPHQPFAEIKLLASECFVELIARRTAQKDKIQVNPNLHTCDLSAIKAPSGHFDIVITSPPYLTRLDYVKATWPELMLLQRLCGINVSDLCTKNDGIPHRWFNRSANQSNLGYNGLRFTGRDRVARLQGLRDILPPILSQIFLGDGCRIERTLTRGSRRRINVLCSANVSL